MKRKTPKLNKIFATLVAACLVLGLLPILTPPAQAANYWDNWTELSSLNIAAGSTLELASADGEALALPNAKNLDNTGEVYFAFSGTPDETAALDDGNWHKVGIITVTIVPTDASGSP